MICIVFLTCLLRWHFEIVGECLKSEKCGFLGKFTVNYGGKLCARTCFSESRSSRSSRILSIPTMRHTPPQDPLHAIHIPFHSPPNLRFTHNDRLFSHFLTLFPIILVVHHQLWSCWAAERPFGTVNVVETRKQRVPNSFSHRNKDTLAISLTPTTSSLICC